MQRAIIYKEWIKTSRVFILCFLLSLAMAIYAVLRMHRLIALKGPEHLWLIMLLKDNSFVEVIKWTPLVCGLAISLAQMLPEMLQKRLKLTLHLPYPQLRMALMMLAVGVAELLIIFIVQIAVIVVYDYTILPAALVGRVFLSMLPWYLAGITAYIFVSAICIEGRRARRILLALIGIAIVSIYYEQPALEAYNSMLPAIILFIVCIVALPLGSIIRFKEGRQD